MATVTPGYTFSGPTDPITYTKLNLLGAPTVAIGSGEVTIANLAPLPGTGYYIGSTSASTAAAAIRVNNTSVNIANTSMGFSVGDTASDCAFGVGASGSAKSVWKWSFSTASAELTSTGDLELKAGAAKVIRLSNTAAGTTCFLGDEQQNAVLGKEDTATSRTTGFPFIPTCAGNPSGTPAGSYSGFVPMVIDSTTPRVYFRIGGTWRYAALT